MQCVECGRDVPKDSMFCANCGARLDAPGAEPAAMSPVSDGPQCFKAARDAVAGDAPAEAELWSGTYSTKAMYGQIIGAAIVTILGGIGASLTGPIGWIAFAIGAAVLWGAIGLLILYRRLTVRYRLTTFRFFHETGLLSRTRNRIEVIDINDVTLRQGVWERMFNVGTIRIQSSDQTDPDLDLPGIEDVKYVADLIDDTRRAERQRRGLFMENI